MYMYITVCSSTLVSFFTGRVIHFQFLDNLCIIQEMVSAAAPMPSSAAKRQAEAFKTQGV